RSEAGRRAMRRPTHAGALIISCVSLVLAACGSGDDDAQGPGGSQMPEDLGPPELDDDLPIGPAEGLAPTPPMGWNSWNSFAASVTSADIRAAADIIVESGMRDAGYQYVNIDDGWAAPIANPDADPPIPSERNDDGTVRLDPDFDDGI